MPTGRSSQTAARAVTDTERGGGKQSVILMVDAKCENKPEAQRRNAYKEEVRVY